MSDQAKETGMDRRALLGAVGAVAAGSMVLDAAFGEGPAAKVEDRCSSIRITALKAMPAGPKAYVKIETNHQIIGWGEITGLEPRVGCALAQRHGRKVVFPYLAEKLLQHQFMPLLDEDIRDGTLTASHKALILTSINYLDPEVVQGIEAFIKQ